MIFAVNDARGALYGVRLTTGERCLCIFTDFQKAWRVAMAQPHDAAVLELTHEEALVMLEHAREGREWNRVALDAEPNAVRHKSFSQAMEWARREVVKA